MKDLAEPFGSMMGTKNYYRHRLIRDVLYTDGIKDMCETLRCWWIIDLIASYQGFNPAKSCSYQVWKIVIDNHSALAQCYDYDNKAIISQNIQTTDLPDGQILCVCIDNGDCMIVALSVED